MAHMGRTVKNVEAPRPLKSQSRSSLKNNFILIEELIQLIENVALTLESGINNMEPMATLVQNLRIHGPQLEIVAKDTLDRAFVVFRNASQDERLNLMTRLNLLQLIELRAKGWEDNGSSTYYKTKQATNIEIPEAQLQHHHQHHSDVTQAAFLSTSPTFGAGSAALAAAVAAVGSAQQQQLLLGPGELIRNSGKFPKPTKIPGKTYCKDEVVIRNADSGKVMGIKGRRVHMIEELSETIISFQRVNPGAKERLVQITGPSEDKINYAKQLIEDTIRRNASPVRLDPAMGTHTGGSCSSLASSNSDEATPRATGAGSGAGGGGPLANRLSLNSAQNFMTASAAAAAQQAAAVQQASVAALLANTTSNAAAVNAAGNVMRPNQQMLLHSYSTNDASLGEYKYTVNVGQHLIKITGDCCDLVRVAKLVLDDYFSSAEFLASVEAGAAFDGSMVSPMSAPSTPMGAPQFMMGTSLQMATPLADSGIGLNYMAGQIANNANDGDDDVFVDANGLVSSQNNGLARSRRSHFSRKDSTPEAVGTNTSARFANDSGNGAGKTSTDSARVVHEYEHLLYYAKSPHSWALPAEWQKICEKCPAIIRNKVTHVSTNTTTVFRVANTTTTTNIGTSLSNSYNSFNNNSNNNNMKIASPVPTVATMPSSEANSLCHLLDDKNSTMQLNIRRKGFFNRQTYSIDEEGYTAELMLQQQQYQPQSQSQPQKSQNYFQNNCKELTSVCAGAVAAAFTSTTAAVTSSSDISVVKSSTESLNNNNSNYTTTTAPTPNHNNNNSNNINNNNSNSNNSQKNLLNKQIKLITAITEQSDRKCDYSEYSVLNEDEPILIEDSTDDDEVKSNEVANKEKSQVQPKFQREYRSNSTCN